MTDALDAFAVDAEVTLPAGSPITTRVFWLPSTTEETPQGEFARAEQRRRLVIPVADVSEVPRGTIVNVPEADGGDAVDWRVEQSDKIDYDHHRAVVIRAPEPVS